MASRRRWKRPAIPAVDWRNPAEVGECLAAVGGANDLTVFEPGEFIEAAENAERTFRSANPTFYSNLNRRPAILESAPPGLTAI
jgi:hypothetical protein